MPFLTIFTPSYNRAKTLPRLYESLKIQTCTDFEWIVIDDGSVDDTKEVVDSFLRQPNRFSIKYYYKENGGLHTAYNLAIEKMTDSVLALCVDSDDWVPENCVELIKNKWLAEGSDEYCGILGLDYSPDGKPIGDFMPEQKSINKIDLSIGKYRIKNGDKADAIRIDLYKSVAPQKSFPGEKYFNPSYMIMLISRNYDFLVLNECLKIVEYQPGGMTDSIFRQYLDSPNSFMEIRRMNLSFEGSGYKYKLRQYVHIVAESLIAGRYFEVVKNYNSFIVILSTLPGIVLKSFIKKKGRKK